MGFKQIFYLMFIIAIEQRHLIEQKPIYLFQKTFICDTDLGIIIFKVIKYTTYLKTELPLFSL